MRPGSATDPAMIVAAVAPPEQALLDEWGTLEAEQASRDALEVVRLVEELDADLVAMGTRGLGALHHALLGSVALKVAIGSPVPVMLVP